MQVGQRAGLNVERHAGDVVALVAELGHLVVIRADADAAPLGHDVAVVVGEANVGFGIGERQQVEVAGNVLRQLEAETAGVTAVLVQDASMLDFGKLQVAGVERRISRQEETVPPTVLAGVAGADIADRELRGDELAGLATFRRYGQRCDLQIRLAIEHREIALALVVLFAANAFVGGTGVELIAGTVVTAPVHLAIGNVRVVGVRVGDHIQEVIPGDDFAADAARQGHLGRRGVGLVGAQRRRVAVGVGAQQGGALRDEHRVRRQPDGIDPVAGSVPDRAADVLHRPLYRGDLAGIVFRRRVDGSHAQV